MAGFLDQIEPLKQAALAELRAAPDLAALEQARVNHLGSNGKFTALMKQLGTLSKEEKPAAGKAINSAKVELEAALPQRRGELELKAALPADPPLSPEPFDAILADLDRIVMPGLSHWQHPNFFGYFPSNGELASVLGDYVSTGLGVLGLAYRRRLAAKA